MLKTLMFLNQTFKWTGESAMVVLEVLPHKKFVVLNLLGHGDVIENC